MKRTLILLALLALTGCSTDPGKIPEIQASRLPAMKFEGMKPAAVALNVQVTRDANLQKGNAEAVKDVIRNAVLSSLERGGTAVDPKSPNKMVVTVQTCQDATPEDECVAIRAELTTSRFVVGVTGQGSHGLRRAETNSPVPGVGNIDHAYEIALEVAFEGLPQQYWRYQR